MKMWNRRQRILIGLGFSVVFLAVICIWGSMSTEEARVTDFSRKNIAPCLEYIFGTDWLGRDMLARTLKGLSISILIGILAAVVSAAVALILGIASAAMGKTVDTVISFCIDLIMGIPHMLLLILISVALGKGLKGVVIGVALTHWPSLARLIRAEVIQLRESPYIQISRKLGKSSWYIARKHMLPHLVPQFIVGLVLMFPHAILHESSITFLGFGLSTEQPAIGIVLSEAMQYLITGKWWLALFPGLLLVFTVVLFYIMGESLRKMLDPGSIHQ
ncbi:MAG TPA: ABC transporter permease [Candidatus Blautia ornithocaccae]|nr:ABC transporter permease [Candidatus Blautia ornithocaccae]